MSWMVTRSGVDFDLENPRAEDVRLDDIVYALSRICRFTGHCSRHYSVLEHSLIGARALYRNTGNKWLAREFLLHDAHEAYMGDISSPVKWACPEIKAMESVIDSAIRIHFGMAAEMPAEVKEMDLKMLLVEKRCLLQGGGKYWPILDGVEFDKQASDEVWNRKYSLRSKCQTEFLAMLKEMSK